MQHNEDGYGDGHEEEDKPLAVAVITPDGIYPDENSYRRAYGEEKLAEILELAKTKLKLTNTDDWDAYHNNRPLDPKHTFTESHLHGIVEIQWHKREGGGGA